MADENNNPNKPRARRAPTIYDYCLEGAKPASRMTLRPRPPKVANLGPQPPGQDHKKKKPVVVVQVTTPKAPSPNINGILPRDCMLEILYRVPLSDLIKYVPHVCPYWRSLMPVALLRRRSLTLLVGLNPLCIDRRPFNTPYLNGVHDPITGEPLNEPYSDRAVLRFDELHRVNTDWLTQHMPNVDRLEVAVDQVGLDNAHELLYILTGPWAQQLVSAKIFVRISEPTVAEKCEVSRTLALILDSINEMTSLRSLWFAAWHYLNVYAENNYKLNISILSQLEQFHFYVHNSSSQVYDSLRHYALANPALREINLANSLYREEEVDRYLAFARRPQMAAAFKGLSCTCVSMQQLTALSLDFSQLSTLEIGLTMEIRINVMIKCLVPLKSLVRFELMLDVPVYKDRFMPAPDCPVQSNVPAPEPDEPTYTLPSVKALFLVARTDSHEQLAPLQMERHFPGLEVLKLQNRYSPCDTCKIRPDLPRAIIAEMKTRCLDMMVKPFTEAAKAKQRDLRTFYKFD